MPTPRLPRKYAEPMEALTAALQDLARIEQNLRPEQELGSVSFWRFADHGGIVPPKRGSWTYQLTMQWHVTGHDYPASGEQTPEQRVAILMQHYTHDVERVLREDAGSQEP